MDKRDVIRGQGKLEDRLQYISSNTVNSDPLTPEGRSKRNFLKYVIPSALVLALGGAAAWYHFCYKPGQNPPPGTTTSTTQRTTGINHPPVIPGIKIWPKYINPTTEYLIKLSTDAYDPDNDPLTYNWSIGGKDVSHEASFSTKLPEGRHWVGLEVSDGIESVGAGNSVTVEPDQIYPTQSLYVRYKGIGYSAGTYSPSTANIPTPTIDEMDEQLQTIHNELGCNAIMIYGGGDYENNLIECGRIAVEKGFELVYLQPKYLDATPEETIERIAKFADKVRVLREKYGNAISFCIGHEFGLETLGMIPGDNWNERLEYQIKHPYEEWVAGVKRELPEMFRKLIPVVKEIYNNGFTYAAAVWEADLVPWDDPSFEAVCTNAYLMERYGQTKSWVINHLRSLEKHKKPVFSSEWGCITTKGGDKFAGAPSTQEILESPYDEETQRNYIYIYGTDILNQAKIAGCIYTIYNENWDKGYGLYYNKKRKRGWYQYKAFERVDQ